ncbi:hypothetical protein SRHO_G00217040 [Serrasalmus rhombeus]
MADCVLFLLVGFLVFLLLFLGPRRPKNFPPGPAAISLFGNVLQLSMSNPMEDLDRLAKHYGNVFSLYIGRKPAVVLHGLRAVREALVVRAADFAGRPQGLMVNHVTENKETRAVIIALHKNGLTGKSIAARKIAPQSTIYRIIKNFKERGSIVAKKAPGRPRKTSKRQDRLLKVFQLRDRATSSAELAQEWQQAGVSASARTVRRRLLEQGLVSRRAEKKPLLSRKNIRDRLIFCKRYREWTAEDWGKVIFSDESPFRLFGTSGKQLVRRRRGERYHQSCLMPTVKHPETIHVWGCFSAKGIGSLAVLPKNTAMNKEWYQNVLREQLLPTVQEQFGDQQCLFQHDGAPCHKAKIYDSFPFLRHLPLPFRKVFENYKALKNHTRGIVAEHKKTRIPGEPRDVIDCYLDEMEKRGSEGTSLDEDRLVMFLLDLHFAGTDTTSNTILTALLYLATYRDVQVLCQQEIDSVLQAKEHVTYEDRLQMPFVQATIHELQRLANIAPLGVFHATTRNTQLMGYDIPEGTLVITNLTSILYEQGQWAQPNDFYPSHFLNEQGEFVKPEAFLAFSAGPRVCLGEALARMELFLILVTLLWRFHFVWPNDCGVPDLRPVFGGIQAPKPYRLTVIPRRNKDNPLDS